MRLLNAGLFLLMILFMAVQYNDPDGPLWMLIYSIPAVWTGIAMFKGHLLRIRPAQIGLLLCGLGAVAGMVYYWPSTPGWWRQEVWWEVETAREGMGMMVVAIVLAVVWFSRPVAHQPEQAAR